MEEGAVTHAWLADFGLTRRVGGARRLTVSGQVLGTIDYVAPEQIEGGRVDGRADQYSLGCVLFECLTGVVPFRRDSELAVLWAHVNDPPPRIAEHRPELPTALDDAIGQALAKAPGDRYPSCGALVAAAQAALTGTGAAPAGVRPRVGGPGRRRPGPAWLARRPVVLLATAALLVAVVVVAILVARDGRAPAGPAAPTLVRNPTPIPSPSRWTRARTLSPPRRTPTPCGWRPRPRAEAVCWPALTQAPTRSGRSCCAMLRPG
jgi:hypothetical protein